MTFRLLQLTDLHVFSDPDARLKGIPTGESLGHVLDLIRARNESFDRMIVTGDHTHDELETTYRLVRGMLGEWTDRLHLVPGNHDDRDLIRLVFDDVVPTDRDFIPFSFELGEWQFIGLDSHVPGEVPGRIEVEQMDWLAAQVELAGDRCIGLFLHHPPVPVDSVWMDQIALQEPEPLLSLIQQTPGVRFVSCGHVHHDSTGRIGAAQLFTTPSTGIQFDPLGDEPTYSTDPPGYRVFEFEGAEFRTEVVRLPEARFVPVPDP